MKKHLSKILVSLFFLCFSYNATATIDSTAPAKSYLFEQATAFASQYVNIFYQYDYDSDALMIEAAKLHDVLHDWQSGAATEADVDAQMAAVKLTWNTFRQTISSSGILNSGDDQCDQLYIGIKDRYKELRLLLNNAARK